MTKKTTAAAVPAKTAPALKKWEVLFHKEFLKGEWAAMSKEQKKALAAAAAALEIAGPSGGRPLIGTLKNSPNQNMKELRYNANNKSEVWRAAFAFDPNQKAIILVAGDKQGVDETKFYKDLLTKANKRYDKHLETTATKTPANPATSAKKKTPAKVSKK